jgi:phosphoribosylamine--glycine ligase
MEGIRAFGPKAAAARIESSKVFTRELLRELGVAQPEFEVFSNPTEAITSLENRNEFPVVIKADGLAAGKGVIIANNLAEAKAAVEEIMEEKAFGDAGEKILIEDFMEGKEVSYFVLTDGKDILPLPTAQDYKRIGNGDTGPNTGGMGCYSPSVFLSEEQAKTIREKIILPTIRGLSERDAEYKGFLYCGLMITKEGPKVLEYNCRMGDPEAEVIIPRIDSDLVPLMEAVIDGKLSVMGEIKENRNSAVTLIAASKGYPGKTDTGYEITGVENIKNDDIVLFFAGVGEKEGKLINSGGRVLALTALGENIARARKNAYDALKNISFNGMQYRSDIAKDAE